MQNNTKEQNVKYNLQKAVERTVKKKYVFEWLKWIHT